MDRNKRKELMKRKKKLKVTIKRKKIIKVTYINWEETIAVKSIIEK